MTQPLTRAEIVRKAAATRWATPGARKVVRLDSLEPPERELVLALVRMAEARKAEGTP